MKRIVALAVTLALALTLTGCGDKKEDTYAASVGFSPALDTKTECALTVAGNYNNFESLEAAFDRFNTFYPNVQLSYIKLDDYNNTIPIVLESKDAPNIYTTYSWMANREQYIPCFKHAENLADPALKLDLGCLRPGILFRGEDNTLPMVPVFATANGMLINEDLFEKEGLAPPTTLTELREVCAAFREKGYSSPMMGYVGDVGNTCFFDLIYPYFCNDIASDAELIQKLNNLDISAGEAMRSSLELASSLVAEGCIDMDVCSRIESNYEPVIMRFLEGDVPMMICSGDTVSGTRKRESQSEAFAENPFTYAFLPVPLTENGGIFLDRPSLQFSVNKDCENLDMTNEFMRFLITETELSAMAEAKRLVTPTKDLSFDSVYAAFDKIPAERTISPEALGIQDNTTIQLRGALFNILNGTMTIDEAIAAYGTFVL